jgi:hypothetical protein
MKKKKWRSKWIVHYLQAGVTRCQIQMPGLPMTWPSLHRWSDNWDEVSCPACLLHRGHGNGS